MTVVVSGPASSPKLEFIADPPTFADGSPLTRRDILVLITKGTLPTNANREFGDQGVNFVVSEVVGQASQVPLNKILEELALDDWVKLNIDSEVDEDGTYKAGAIVQFDVIDDVELLLQWYNKKTTFSLEVPIHE